MTGGRTSAAAAFPEHRDRVIVTGAASKTWAMTGWRLGWAAGPRDVMTAMTSYQSHSTSNASSIAQAAVLAALNDPERTERSVAEMLGHYAERRAAMLGALEGIPGVRVRRPEGSFYAFADVSALFPRVGVAGSVDFCSRLLQEAHVAAVPGDAFGNDACVRFSFATGIERVARGHASARGVGRRKLTAPGVGISP